MVGLELEQLRQHYLGAADLADLREEARVREEERVTRAHLRRLLTRPKRRAWLSHLLQAARESRAAEGHGALGLRVRLHRQARAELLSSRGGVARALVQHGEGVRGEPAPRGAQQRRVGRLRREAAQQAALRLEPRAHLAARVGHHRRGEGVAE